MMKTEFKNKHMSNKLILMLIQYVFYKQDWNSLRFPGIYSFKLLRKNMIKWLSKKHKIWRVIILMKSSFCWKRLHIWGLTVPLKMRNWSLKIHRFLQWLKVIKDRYNRKLMKLIIWIGHYFLLKTVKIEK